MTKKAPPILVRGQVSLPDSALCVFFLVVSPRFAPLFSDPKVELCSVGRGSLRSWRFCFEPRFERRNTVTHASLLSLLYKTFICCSIELSLSWKKKVLCNSTISPNRYWSNVVFGKKLAEILLFGVIWYTSLCSVVGCIKCDIKTWEIGKTLPFRNNMI